MIQNAPLGRTADLHPEETGRPEATRPGPWRDEARSRATRLRTEARWLALRDEVLPGAVGEPMDVEIFRPLDRVDDLITRDRVSPRGWWSGSQVEECWRLLRQAEEGLVQVAGDDGVRVRAKAIQVHGEKDLGSDHPFVKELLEDLKSSSTDPQRLRTTALNVVRASHEKSDRQHRQVRSFRNQLLASSILLAILATTLLLGQYMLGARLMPAPEGVSLSANGTLALVMFFGCIGALFSAVPSLAQIPETSSPFNLPRQQAALKVVTGAWSAVIGLLVVDAGLAGTQPQMASLGGLAILAALFGSGQEAVTRFADHKASGLLPSD